MNEWVVGDGRVERVAAEPSRKIRVMLAVHQLLVRQGLVALLSAHPGFTLVSDQIDRDHLLGAVLGMQPDVVLYGCELQENDSLDAIRALCSAAPAVRVVILSESQSGEDALRAIMAGASGFLSMSGGFHALARTIEAVGNGEVGLSRELTGKLVRWLQQTNGWQGASNPAPDSGAQDLLNRLSARERMILVCIGRGESNKGIARELSISEHTVRSHVTNILTKLGMASRVQAAVLAIGSHLNPSEDASLAGTVPASRNHGKRAVA